MTPILTPEEIIKSIPRLYDFVVNEIGDNMDCELVNLVTKAIRAYHEQFGWRPIEEEGTNLQPFVMGGWHDGEWITEAAEMNVFTGKWHIQKRKWHKYFILLPSPPKTATP